nr:O-antigen polymerase [Psychrobacter sp. Ps3]
MLFYICLLFFVVLLMPNTHENFDPFLNISFSIIFLILILSYFLKRRRYIKNWLRFDLVFLIGYFIVHFQSSLLYSIGLDDQVIPHPWVNIEVVNYATWLSLLAIIFWFMGTTLVSEKKYYLLSKVERNNVFVDRISPMIDKVIVVSFALFIVVAGSALFSGIYDGGRSWGAGAGYFYLLLTFSIYLRTIYFVLSLEKKTSIKHAIKSLTTNKIYVASLLFFVLMFLSVGDRGPVISVVLLFFTLYGVYVKPFSFKTVVVSMVIAALLMTILGLGRTRIAENIGSQGIIERGYTALISSDEIIIPSAELAGSNKILFAALDNVPTRYPYLYGKSFVINFSSALPIPGVTQLFTDLLEIPKYQTTTTHYFTYILIGTNPTWGAGSEVVADVYVNFGVFGIPVVFFLFGLVCARYSFATEHFGKHVKVSFIIVYAGLVVNALSINRGMLLYPLMPIFYMLTLYWLLRITQSGLRKFK